MKKIQIEFERTGNKEMQISLECDSEITVADAMCVFQALDQTMMNAICIKIENAGIADLNEDSLFQFADSVKLKEFAGVHKEF